MFSTIDLNSPQNAHIFGGPSSDLVSIGKSTQRRSKTGCLTCRKRKKKCDEARPVCEFCEKRGLSCDWEIKQYFSSSKNVSNFENANFQPKEGPINHKKRKFNKIEEIPENSPEIHQLEQPFSPIGTSNPLGSVERTVIEEIQNQELDGGSFGLDLALGEITDPTYSPIFIQPSSTFNLFLDDTGLIYLKYFESNVANLLSISPRSSNYFLKTFFTLAITNESILNALAAWGALFYTDNANHDIVNQYLQKSKEVATKTLLDKYDYFLTLAYYLINIGIQICSGDTGNWHKIFIKCCNLLGKYGGVKKFIKDFNYSNDCKFLIANFQYHDVMSSETLTNGTRCLLSNYSDIFETQRLFEEEENYGIDPYQGCIQPIVLLLGEIMNAYAKIKVQRLSINNKLNIGPDGGNTLDDKFDVSSYNKINQVRAKHLENIERLLADLSLKVKFCKPVASQLNQLPTEEDRQKHIQLFELYRMTCQIYLALYFKQTQPISCEVQSLLLNSFKVIDELIDSNLIGAFNMTLLICGISCCNDYDRMNLDSKFQRIYSAYKVGNVKRIWGIVKESWRRNSNGVTCIDWIDICDDFGWKISFC